MYTGSTRIQIPRMYCHRQGNRQHREPWSRAAANEFGRLFNGVGKNADGTQRVKGTNTCRWIKKSQVPKGKRVTYARIVVAVRPEKEEINRVRITVGGNLLDYLGEIIERYKQ
jgi:hypothetical protein